MEEVKKVETVGGEEEGEEKAGGGEKPDSSAEGQGLELHCVPEGKTRPAQ